VQHNQQVTEKLGGAFIINIKITKVSTRVSLNKESIYVAVWELRDNPSDTVLFFVLCQLQHY